MTIKNPITVNHWLIDSPSGSIIHVVTGEKKRLGEYQLKMLEVLLEHRGVILTREELTSLVWGQRVIGNNSLPNAIHALRIALEDDGKLQKIIKTIPKKGYLLEEEYCRIASSQPDALTNEADDDNPHLASSPDPLQTHHDYPDLPAIHSSENTLPENTPLDTSSVETLHSSKIKHPFRHNLLRIFSIVIIAVLVVMTSWYFFSKQNDPLVAIEQGKSIYSNIRLYELERKNEIKLGNYSIHNNLEDTFYTINQQLKLNSVFMNVYYNSVDQTLNYTFTLRTYPSRDCQS